MLRYLYFEVSYVALGELALPAHDQHNDDENYGIACV